MCLPLNHPRHEFERQANLHDGKRRSDALSRWSQFVALAIGQLGGRRSLCDIESTIHSQGRHRYHLGSQTISRSGLSRANEQLDYRFFEGLFQSLYRRCMSNQRSHGFRFKNKLFSLDASLIVLERRAVNKACGVTSDKTIEYVAQRKDGTPLKPIRRVGYRDPDTGKHYVFITNQYAWCAKTIADIYGTSENAVMTQIMAALCVYLLLAYLKFQSKISKSLQQIIRLLQLNLFTRRSLHDLLQPPDQGGLPPPQLKFGLVRN